MSKRKPKTMPYVFIDIDVGGDGATNVPPAIHANCSLWSPEWPTKCPYYRSFAEPPHEGAECCFYHGGDCFSRELFRDALLRFREFVDEQLAVVEGGGS